MMAFQEINPGTWTYEKDGDSIEGILVKKESNVGENKANLYTLENKDGFSSVWGSTILDQRMGIVQIGDRIRITYKGVGEAKSGRNPPKIFKVEIDRDTQ